MTPKSEEQKGKEGVGKKCVVQNMCGSELQNQNWKYLKVLFLIIDILKLLATVITKSKTLQQKLDESALVSKMM